MVHSVSPLSGDEQLSIELMNRARMTGPIAEAARMLTLGVKNGPGSDPAVVNSMVQFSVVPAQFTAQMAALQGSIGILPPLAPNQRLNNTSRQHSQWMFQSTLQEHDQDPANPNQGDILDRVRANGYNPTYIAENIYAYSEGPLYQHAGFIVDWGDAISGPTAFGMQTPPAHRINIYSASVREVGTGIFIGVKYDPDGWILVGPQLGTQQFGSRQSATPVLTGVVYLDRNGNQFYDSGEGLPQVTVSVTGQNDTAITAEGGGYALPLPSTNATYAVKFTAPDGTVFDTSATIAGLKNAKCDWIVPSSVVQTTLPPLATLPQGITTPVTWPKVPGVVGYTAVSGGHAPLTKETCDSLSAVTTAIAPGYTLPLLQSTIKVGTTGSAFHLSHTNSTADQNSQTVTFKSYIIPRAGASITFQSRLLSAYDNQQARVQASIDDGLTWTDLWMQAGNTPDNNNFDVMPAIRVGEAAFSLKTIPASALAPFVNRLTKLRLAYTYTQIGAGWLVTSSGNTSGWVVDDITFTNVSEVTSFIPIDIPSNSLNLRPTSTTTRFYSVRPRVATMADGWPYGPIIEPTVVMPPPSATALLAQESALGLAPGTLTNNPQADPDNDGIPVLVEIAMGRTAGTRDTAPSPTPPATGTGQVSYTYTRDVSVTDVSLDAQFSNLQGGWFIGGQTGAPYTSSDSVVSTQGTIQTRVLSITVPPGRMAVFRLQARKI